MYEKGKRVVDVELVRNLCDKFNVSVEWLIFGDSELQSLQESHSLEPSVAMPPVEKPDNLDMAPVIAEKDAQIDELKSELIAAQAGALKAYELAVEAIQQGAEPGLKKSAKSPLRGRIKEDAAKVVRSKKKFFRSRGPGEQGVRVEP
jgi:hypothetical protein